MQNGVFLLYILQEASNILKVLKLRFFSKPHINKPTRRLQSLQMFPEIGKMVL